VRGPILVVADWLASIIAADAVAHAIGALERTIRFSDLVHSVADGVSDTVNADQCADQLFPYRVALGGAFGVADHARPDRLADRSTGVVGAVAGTYRVAGIHCADQPPVQ
jgi:hypothetical protein